MTSIVASDEPLTPGQTPSAQEIQRKLSVAQRKGKTRAAVAQNSGTDTEDEIQMLGANDTTIGGIGILGGGNSSGGAGGGAGTSSLPGSQPLSAIAERTMSGAEESDEEEEDVEGGWQTAKSIGNRPTGVVPGGFGAADNKLAVLHSGYLWKKGSGRRKTWKKRWFVLRPTHLACYKTSAEYKLLRLLDVADIHAATPVQLKRHPNTCGIVTRARTFYFQAETSAEMDAWVSKLNSAKEALQNAAASSKAQQNVPGTPVVIPPSSPSPATTTTHTGTTAAGTGTGAASTSPGSGTSLANVVMAVKSPPSISIVVPSTSPSSGPHDPSSPLSAIPSTSKAGGGGGGGGSGGKGGDGNTSSDSDEPGSSQHQAGGRASTSNRGAANALSPSSKEKDKDPGKTVMSGYLMKCGSHRKSWRKRWFVLTTTRIVYMGSHMDVKPHKQIMLNQILDAMEWRPASHGNRDVARGRAGHDATLEGKPIAVSSGTTTAVATTASGEQTASSHHQQTSASSGQPGPSDPTTTMIHSGATNYTFKVITPKKTLLLSAPSEEEEVRWISAIRALIARRTKETEAKEKEAERATTTNTGNAASGAGASTAATTGDGRKRSSSKHLETQPTATVTS